MGILDRGRFKGGGGYVSRGGIERHRVYERPRVTSIAHALKISERLDGRPDPEPWLLVAVGAVCLHFVPPFLGHLLPSF